SQDTQNSDDTPSYPETIYTTIASLYAMTSNPTFRDTETTTTILEVTTTYCDTTAANDFNLSVENRTLNSDDSTTQAQFPSKGKTPTISTVTFDESTTSYATTICVDTTFSTFFVATYTSTFTSIARDTDTTSKTLEISTVTTCVTSVDITFSVDITASNSQSYSTFDHTATAPLITYQDKTSDATSALEQFTIIGQTTSISTVIFDETITECETTIFVDTSIFSETIYTSIATAHSLTSTPIVRDPFT
ncbi:MAG: hypothetical protein ACK559_14960, partial [bacterium]